MMDEGALSLQDGDSLFFLRCNQTTTKQRKVVVIFRDTSYAYRIKRCWIIFSHIIKSTCCNWRNYIEESSVVKITMEKWSLSMLRPMIFMSMRCARISIKDQNISHTMLRNINLKYLLQSQNLMQQIPMDAICQEIIIKKLFHHNEVVFRADFGILCLSRELNNNSSHNFGNSKIM